MSSKRTQKQLEAASEDVFAREIAALEAKRLTMQKLIVAVDEAEAAHRKVVHLRDELEAQGMARSGIIKALSPTMMVGRVLRAKPEAVGIEQDVPVSDEAAGEAESGWLEGQ